MTQIYAFSQGFEEFFSASQQFEHLVNRLRSKEAAQMEHGEIEDLVDQEGRELLRRLFQGYLDRRCSNEVQHEAIEDPTVFALGIERSVAAISRRSLARCACAEKAIALRVLAVFFRSMLS